MNWKASVSVSAATVLITAWLIGLSDPQWIVFAIVVSIVLTDALKRWMGIAPYRKE